MNILSPIIPKLLTSIKRRLATFHESLNQRFPRLPDFINLTRLNRPIGIYLLLWPTYWALWVAAEGLPTISNLIVFTLGVVLMRSAGCIINDYADRHIDGDVKRTKDRPLAVGKISGKEALLFFTGVCFSAFLLVLLTNELTIWMSIGGLGLASLYPFMKRYTYLPQVVLGAAFGWAVPMAFAAETNSLPDLLWLIYLTTLLWTVAYDTQYAMVDRDDDLKIGVRSTAILFGDMDVTMIATLQMLALGCWLLLGLQIDGSWAFYGSTLIASVGFVYQYWLYSDRSRSGSFDAFLSNHWVGLILFTGLVIHYL